MYNAQHRYDEKQKLGQKLKDKGASYGFRAYNLNISNTSSQVAFLDLGVCSNARGLYDDILQSFPQINIVKWNLEGKAYLCHFTFKDDAFKLPPNDIQANANVPMVPNKVHQEPEKEVVSYDASSEKESLVVDISGDGDEKVVTIVEKIKVKKGKKKNVD